MLLRPLPTRTSAAGGAMVSHSLHWIPRYSPVVGSRLIMAISSKKQGHIFAPSAEPKNCTGCIPPRQIRAPWILRHPRIDRPAVPIDKPVGGKQFHHFVYLNIFSTSVLIRNFRSITHGS